jgi:hypothetical protein
VQAQQHQSRQHQANVSTSSRGVLQEACSETVELQSQVVRLKKDLEEAHSELLELKRRCCEYEAKREETRKVLLESLAQSEKAGRMRWSSSMCC